MSYKSVEIINSKSKLSYSDDLKMWENKNNPDFLPNAETYNFGTLIKYNNQYYLNQHGSFNNFIYKSIWKHVFRFNLFNLIYFEKSIKLFWYFLLTTIFSFSLMFVVKEEYYSYTFYACLFIFIVVQLLALSGSSKSNLPIRLNVEPSYDSRWWGF